MNHFEPIAGEKPSLIQSIAVKSLNFAHIGLFIAAALVGIARYSHAVPANLTVAMTIWSVILLLHTYLTDQEERRAAIDPDGIFQTAWWAVIVNAIMWVMWSMATDASVSAPWHLTIFMATAAGGVIGAIAGKRRLYAHWAKKHGFTPQKSKVKRRELSLEALELDDDGELPETDYFDTTDSIRNAKR